MKIKTAKDLMRRYLDEDWSVLPVYKEPLEAINGIYTGDCIDVCRRLMLDGTHVDLVYMDPPYNTGRSFTKGLYSFDDNFGTGLDGMYNYLRYLYPRVLLMHRVLNDTGSIYLHCDWHANSYIRTLILDPVFGEGNFRNEVIWSYSTGGASKSHYAKKHDTIFFYSKSKDYNFNAIREGEYRTQGMNYDEEGRPYKTTKKGRLYFNIDGPLITDVWDMPFLSTVSKERIGYPTQKPEALLERIIKASSNEGDIVLDPFMGGGTTALAAKRLKRKFIGCDISSEAVKVSIKRLLV